MASNFFTLSVLLAVLFVTAHAASTSYSCVMMNGQRKCAYKDDPDGNIAAAAAGIGGGMGAAGAGAGTQDNFNTDYQQIGNPMDFVRDFMSRFGGYRQIPAY